MNEALPSAEYDQIMTATVHPKSDDNGKPVVIHHPSMSTSPETWNDPGSVAAWTPESPVPDALNGIPIGLWKARPITNQGWLQFAGQANIDEPPQASKSGKAAASGCIIVETDGRVWIVSPTNKFGGYTNTFPKGKTEGKLPLQQNAIKEAYEEAGLQVELIAVVGDFERTTSVTRYYLARRVGGSPAEMTWESQAVHLVPQAALPKLLTNPTDGPVLKALATVLAKA